MAGQAAVNRPIGVRVPAPERCAGAQQPRWRKAARSNRAATTARPSFNGPGTRLGTGGLASIKEEIAKFGDSGGHCADRTPGQPTMGWPGVAALGYFFLDRG